MKKSITLQDILKNLELKHEKIPNLNQWKEFLSIIESEIEQNEFELDQKKIELDLGLEEMQKVWTLIKERENLIKSILDSSLDMIIIMNEKFEVIEFNHAAENFFGLTKNLVQGHSLFDVIKGGSLLTDLKSNLNTDLKSTQSEFFGVNHERDVMNKAGEVIPVSVFLSRVVTHDIVIYPLYMRDLSQIKQTEIELEKSRAQVVFSAKLSSLGEMAGGIAHEINTPLAIIQMRTEQLLEKTKAKTLNDAFLFKALEGVDITVKRIAKIVKSLRSFARDGSLDEMQTCSIDTIIEDTFSLCREKFNNHGVRLDYIQRKDFQIDCRASEISQVLLNILNNSFDAIELESNKWIKVETSLTAQQTIEIRITDSGLGISKNLQDKIMSPFFTTKEVGKGTGLGLSISKGIIESHGGRIYINNSCKNTQFVLEFPRYQMQAAPRSAAG